MARIGICAGAPLIAIFFLLPAAHTQSADATPAASAPNVRDAERPVQHAAALGYHYIWILQHVRDAERPVQHAVAVKETGPFVDPRDKPVAAAPAAKPVSAEEARALAAGNNAFSVDLYKKLMAADGNLFFSPYSISTAFAMVYGGARGETAAQMKKAFNFTLPDDRLHAAFAAAINDHNGSPEKKRKYQLSVANALSDKRQSFFPTTTTIIPGLPGQRLLR